MAHSISYLWPAYTSFKSAADEGTIAVISYVSTNIKQLPPQIEALLTKKIGELRTFNKALSKKYYGEIQGLVFHLGQLSIEEEKEERKMQLLLLDADYYGLTSYKG